ncbi:MAG: trigger factor [Mogibacterium sp.]|nr:trigger factor [Mogibacterium sp.]MBR3376909.1 trigger factor [Mogibacterium sp.]
MKATQVSKENGVVKFNIEFSVEEFKDAINKAYLANRSKFQIDGFRKGKAPRKIIESHYGHDIFWDEALNELLDKGYYDALKEMDLEVVSQPSFESPEIKKDEPVVLTGTVQVFPEMEVENYKGLEVEKVETKIGEKEVKAELEKVQKSQARMEAVEDRKTEMGDTLVFDFEGFVDDKPFSGGSAENYELKLGSGQFIPGFEDQLVGKDAGEEVDVQVVFPGDYHAEELAGKPALFKCKIHEIKKEILPEIDDELASDVSEFETLAEYKKDLKKKLQEAAKETDLSVMKDRVLEKLYNENNIKVPEVMINNEVENMLYDMNQSLSAQGLGLQQYVEWTGKTIDELREETKPEAEKRIRTRVLLKNIIRMEKLDVEDEEINELMEDFGKQYGMTVDQVKEMAGSETENYFREDAQTKKAIDWLLDNAKLIEKKAEKKAKAKKEEKKED